MNDNENEVNCIHVKNRTRILVSGNLVLFVMIVGNNNTSDHWCTLSTIE